MSKGRGNAAFCHIDDCGKPAHGHGLCAKHYRRWRTTGSTEDRAEATCGVCGARFSRPRTGGKWAFCSDECRKARRREIERAYRESHQERLAEYERTRERDYDWRRRDPEKLREYNRQRRARLRGAQVAPFETTQLAERLSMFPGCWICGGEASQVDHVKPLAKGGAHMLANLRPICPPCNLRKLARWPFGPSEIAALRAAV